MDSEPKSVWFQINIFVMFSTQTAGVKRKGVTKAGAAARKKPRKKAEPLDENTMVALALSSSLLEQEREQQHAARTQSMASDSSMTPVLKWRPDAGIA